MTKPIRRSNAPDPEKYALSGSEEAHQIALFMWASSYRARELYPELKWLFAIPNGGWRIKSEAARLKAAGVKVGVPDIMLPIRRGAYAGLFIELKRPAGPQGQKRGYASDEQNQWIAQLRKEGYGACVCIGWDMARETIINYLEWK